MALSEDEEIEESKAQVLTTNSDSKVWPPWPWPPWGEDEDGDNDEPVNRTERAHKLSKKIVKLERKLAKASLDL